MKIVVSPVFSKQLKKLKKKSPQIESELSSMYRQLSANPNLGAPVWGRFKKVRMGGDGRGKRGGMRIITTFQPEKDIVYLAAIYDKSDKGDLSPKEVLKIKKELGVRD